MLKNKIKKINLKIFQSKKNKEVWNHKMNFKNNLK